MADDYYATGATTCCSGRATRHSYADPGSREPIRRDSLALTLFAL